MKVQILSGASKKVLAVLNAEPTSTIEELKKLIAKEKPDLYVERQSLRLEPKGKSLGDSITLQVLDLKSDCELYFKDLGPQIGWTTVFFWEYFGPLLMYLLCYFRPRLLYGEDASRKMETVVKIAAVCWTVHYVKRILETFFVHRFSHGTMPIRNLFRNCSYYWMFAFFIGYYINHPLYTPPSLGKLQVHFGLIGFVLSEIGNFSIHIALRNLRPPGSRERKIPRPTSNPFTLAFDYVSCPNYFYEVYAWIFFSIMTQCLVAFLFALAGFYQMAVWALQKHRNYRKDFPDYPKQRKAIIPFLL
uniref:very-long-chain enoyl-CoA reductase n=1 Tax=Centruroides hentzi TaxID=88313 RepID=A0A2I9LPX6_9SCOR